MPPLRPSPTQKKVRLWSHAPPSNQCLRFAPALFPCFLQPQEPKSEGLEEQWCRGACVRWPKAIRIEGPKGSRAAAYPEPIGLKSNIRLSGVLVNMSWITLPDVSTHLRPG